MVSENLTDEMLSEQRGERTAGARHLGRASQRGLRKGKGLEVASTWHVEGMQDDDMVGTERALGGLASDRCERPQGPDREGLWPQKGVWLLL